jgi:glutathione S-transferase
MIVIHHLNDSRSLRILWLLEELGTQYEIKYYQRDPQTRLAPTELEAIHPLGKSPVITDGGRTIVESGAIVDYLIRRHGGGRLQPLPESTLYDEYVQWLHYAEGSAMLPLLLRLYVSRLGDAGKPLHPRINSELARHLGYLDTSLKGRQFLVGDSLTGADIMMSFVAELGGVFQLLPEYPMIGAWLTRMHERPAYQRALQRGGPHLHYTSPP